MKKYLPAFLYTIGICLIGTLITTILYYFNITSDKFNTILLYLVSIISMFVGTFIIGKRTSKKAIIAGSIYYIIFLTIMILLSLLVFKTSFKLSNLIYFIIIYAFSIIGSIIGKNSKEADIN